MTDGVQDVVALTIGLSPHDAITSYAQIRTVMEDTILSYGSGLLRDTAAAFARVSLNHYQLFGSVPHLEESLSIYCDLLGPPREAMLLYGQADVLDDYGEALRGRFEQQSRWDDINHSIALHERSLFLREREGFDTSHSLHCLGEALVIRGCTYQRSYREDHQRAIEVLSRVVKQMLSTDPLRVRALCYLALAHVEYGRIAGDTELLSVKAAYEALALAPQDHPQHALAALAASRALFYSTDALNTSAPLHRYVRALVSGIGHCYAGLIGTAVSGAVLTAPSAGDDLTECLDCIRAIHKCHTAAHVFYKAISTSFGFCLSHVWRITGKLRYVDEKIEMEMDAYMHRDTNERPYRPLMHNLTSSLIERYKRTGSSKDLDLAISISTECYSLRATPLQAGDFAHVVRLGNLLVMRFQRRRTIDDLERAMSLHRECLNCMATLAPDYSWWFAPHAIAALEVYHSENCLSLDLDEILELLKRRLDCTGPWEWRQYTRFNCVATILRILAYKAKDVARAEEAVMTRKRAVDLVNEQGDHADRPMMMKDLALDYICHWELEGPQDSLHTATNILEALVMDPTNALGLRFQAALSWCTYAANFDATILSRAYTAAIDLLPRLVVFGSDFQAKLDAVKQTPSLCADAAMHEMACERPHTALDILERGRALFWADGLRSRHPLDGLPEQLSQQIVGVSRELEKGARGTEPMKALRQRELVNELDALIAVAREHPGFSDLFHSISREKLQLAAHRGHVIMLVCNATSAAAIVLRAGTASIVPVLLPGVNRRILQDLTSKIHMSNTNIRNSISQEGETRKLVVAKQRARDDTYNHVLRDLWSLIVHPLIQALGITRVDMEDRPRVFWCASGPFAFLPLHAASQPSELVAEYASDYVLSSYVPTIGTLVNAYDQPPSAPLGAQTAVLAAVPSASGYTPLPHTSQEIALVGQFIKQGSLLDGEVTVSQFMDMLPSASLLHLACHGTQDPRNPLESGFVFNDGMVKVSSLMDVHVPGACFAFLSACESAMGSTELPDENIHLAAALMFLGYRSVVGTLWSMNDADGPRVAQGVYSELIKNKERFDYDVVPRALDAAVRELCAEGAHASRWATWIHMGI